VAIISYTEEAQRYEGIPAELAWDGDERKAFKLSICVARRTSHAVGIFDFRHRHWRRGAALPSTSTDGDKLNSYNILFMTLGRN
jgi:hypothetical protein